MNTRADKPQEYFAKLLDIPEAEIDYAEISPTAAADWEQAVVLLTITAEEFQAIKEFIRRRREQSGDNAKLITI
jgi:hypothetical protein